MPKLMHVTYTCGCEGFGNPDFQCPKHLKYVVKHQSQKVTNVNVIKCVKCGKELKFDQYFKWRKQNGKLIAAHDKCVAPNTRAWYSQFVGAYTHVKYKENDKYSENYSYIWAGGFG